MGKPVTMKCPQCGKLFKLGYTGANGKCDECQGIERDDLGRVWMPWEKSATFHTLATGEENTIPRPATHKTWKGK